MTSQLHVIIGSGPLGQWTARSLREQGHRVRMVNRSGASPFAPADVEIVRGDATDATTVAQLSAGATTIYQCAQPAYHRWSQEFPALQAAIVAGAAASGAKLVVAENLYIYGDPQDKPLREDTPYAAHTRKGRVRQQMTETLFAAHQAGQIRAASARGSDFFGPYDMISAELVYRDALAAKTINMVGRLDQPHTFTYVADFGRTLATLGTNDAALGRAWHVPSASPVTQRDYLDAIGAVIGKPLQARTAGALLLRALGLFNPSAGEMVEMLYEFERPFVMDSSDFSRTFGIVHTPLDVAIRETIAWNQAQLALPGAAHA